MTTSFKYLICLLWLTSAMAFAADAKDISSIESFDLDSKVLGEKRHILVHLPQSYAKGQSRFPVLYLTDAETQMLHTSGTVDFLARANSMPEMVVVGITHADRMHDLTPTHSTGPMEKTSGGADKFLQFLEEELIPAINQRYRTAPYKVFAGHSLGGLFAIHAYLSHPKTFDAYIAVSPSLWWDGRLLLNRAEAAFADRKAAGVVFLAVGDEGKLLRQPFDGFKAILEKSAGPDLHWSSQAFDDETHVSVVLRAHYQGLKQVFNGWREPRDITFQQLQDHYATWSKRLGYSIMVPEQSANELGYSLMEQDKFDEAINVLTWNTRNYPASANTYDSLCEVLTGAAKLAEAKTQCEKAVNVGQASNDPLFSEFKQHLVDLNARILKKDQ